MEEPSTDSPPTCSSQLTATEVDAAAALRKQKRAKQKKRLAEKSRKKVEKFIAKLQAKIDEMDCREVDFLADDYDEVKEERRYKRMAQMTKKLLSLRESLVKSFPDRYESKVGRDAVEDKLIILGTGNQALNDALTEFVNRPPSVKRRYMSAELGNNYCQYFNLPKPEDVRGMVDELATTHPDMFSKNPIELEKLINDAVDVVYKQVKTRRIEDHKMGIEEFKDWAKDHGEQEPSAEVLNLLNETRPVNPRPVSFAAAQEAIMEAREKGELDDNTADEGDGDDATVDDPQKDASEGEGSSDEIEDEEDRENDAMSTTSAIEAEGVARSSADDPIVLSSDDDDEEEEEEVEDLNSDSGEHAKQALMSDAPVEVFPQHEIVEQPAMMADQPAMMVEQPTMMIEQPAMEQQQ